MTTKAIGLSAAGLAAMAAVAVGAAQLSALAEVAPGEWQLKEIDGTGTRTICVADPAQLLQIRHGSANCTRTVIDSDADSVTVHYTCSGGGSGRTTLTIRSPQSLKVETQGMAGGAPFAFDYDAKRIGNCPGAPSEGKEKPGH